MSDDIVARLRKIQNGTSWENCAWALQEAADEIERLRNELAARCGDARPGAHTAGPSETFIPEAL